MESLKATKIPNWLNGGLLCAGRIWTFLSGHAVSGGLVTGLHLSNLEAVQWTISCWTKMGTRGVAFVSCARVVVFFGEKDFQI